ncbi:MAG: hypothetical protein R3E13_03820 [Alphaproteobacteria bacterium]
MKGNCSNVPYARTDNKQPPKTFAGIDVGKDYLDIFIHPIGVQMQIKNDKSAIKALSKGLPSTISSLLHWKQRASITGSRISMLHDAGIVVAVINPFRSRQFADSLWTIGKDGYNRR